MAIQFEMTSRCPAPKDFPDIELYMDQVISVLEKHLSPFFPEDKVITSTMINNYVKQKLIPPPTNKRYDRNRLMRLFMICILKSHLQLSEIAALLENAGDGRSDRELFDLFKTHFDLSLECVFAGKLALTDPPKNAAEHALSAALMAFCTILCSRVVFQKARETWPVPISQEEKKEMEKREKKEKKEKEKREKEAKEKVRL